MGHDIDKFLFSISTNCFSKIFEFYLGKEIFGLIQEYSRSQVDAIIGKNGNYYLYSNTSDDRKNETELAFLKWLEPQLKTNENLKLFDIFASFSFIQRKKFPRFVEVLVAIERSVADLVVDYFKEPISERELTIFISASEIKPWNYSDWLSAWEQSIDKWDLYLKSAMDGIEEVPFYSFYEIMKVLDWAHIYFWKDKLPKDDFLGLIDYLEKELVAEIKQTEVETDEVELMGLFFKNIRNYEL